MNLSFIHALMVALALPSGSAKSSLHNLFHHSSQKLIINSSTELKNLHYSKYLNTHNYRPLSSLKSKTDHLMHYKQVTPEHQYHVLNNGVQIVVPDNGLLQKLNLSYERGRPLNVKLGFDPTSPNLHLGHAVVLNKMRQFQDFGHKIKIIIGDFTAHVGDPTGVNKTRPALTKAEIEDNAQTYMNQLSKFVDLEQTDVHFNSEWFDQLSFSEVIKLISSTTLAQILQREDFNKRYHQNQTVHLHELIYPVMQAYDSYKIKADIELGGTDQLFNCMMGRHLQTSMQCEEQTVLCLPILKGTDGHKKMGKSLKNDIGIMEKPENLYEKIMSLPDNIIEEYINLIGKFPQTQKQILVSQLSDKTYNPMHIKKELAFNIVQQMHDEQVANQSAEHFQRTVQLKKNAPEDYIRIKIRANDFTSKPITLIDLCLFLSLHQSKRELRNLIHEGGVSINGFKVLQDKSIVENFFDENKNLKLKLGRRKFYNLSFEENF